MTTVKGLYNNLQLFYNLGYRKYSLANPFFNLSNNDKVLTWFNYKAKESFREYDQYYAWVYDNLQYSLEVGDKGFLQFFYEEVNNNILRGSVAFLPCPDSYIPYIRFDMDIPNGRDYYHNSYHANIGYRSDNVRFTLSQFPHPSEFIKFTLFLLGYEEFKSFSKKRFFGSVNEQYSHVIDFVVK